MILQNDEKRRKEIIYYFENIETKWKIDIASWKKLKKSETRKNNTKTRQKKNKRYYFCENNYEKMQKSYYCYENNKEKHQKRVKW